MLAWTRRYTWSELITNKNKQAILISPLLNPFPQFPFSIDWNTDNFNSDVFYKPFPPSVSPSYWFCVVHEVQILAKQCQLTRAVSSEIPRSRRQCRRWHRDVAGEVVLPFAAKTEKQKRRPSMVLLLISQPRGSVLARASVWLSRSWFDNRRGQGCRTCFKFKVFCACSWQAEENCTTGSRNGSSTGDGTSHCEEKHWRGESLTSF